MSSDTARYVQRLRVHLHLDDALEADFLREIETHMDDRIAALVARGVPEERARRTTLEGFGRPQTLAHLMRQAQQIASWSEALLGAAPFALLAVLVGLGLWRTPLVAVLASAVVVVVTLYGLWLGRPAWFYPWAGVALLMPIFAGYIAFAVLNTQIPALVAGGGSPLVLAGIAGAALYFPVGLVVVGVSVLVAVRRDWLDASILLTPLPIALAWVIELHRDGGLLSAGPSLSGLAPVLGVIALCAMVAMVIFLRATTRATKILTLVTSAILLVSTATLLIDPTGDVIALAGRAIILLAFLLSPALVARQA